MSTAISSTIAMHHESRRSFWLQMNEFLSWSSNQQENRLGWQGISLLAFSCFLTPLSILMISLSGANMFLIMTVLVAMEVNLVANLITMPTKITIPAFFLTALTDLVVIVVSAIAII
ncbi:MAG TPA: hypothetical protein VFI33_15475 [Puia sp.]|nr:hypothetical protein [Puia sp.]